MQRFFSRNIFLDILIGGKMKLAAAPTGHREILLRPLLSREIKR
jgi:hypothetical protein